MDGENNSVMPRPIDYMEPSFASSVADKTSVHHNIDNIIYENERDRSFNEFTDYIQDYQIDLNQKLVGPPFKLSPVSNVSDIFNNAILRHAWEDRGSPLINMIPGAGRSDYAIDRRKEMVPFESETQPVDTMNVYSYTPESHFIAELGHADQYKRNEGESMFDWKMRRRKQHFQSIEELNLGRERYEIPGTEEWDAHKIKEQQIYDMFPEGYNLSGKDSLLQRMKREQWRLWGGQ